jgi:hypothetical protein
MDIKKLIGYLMLIGLILGGINHINSDKGCINLYIDYGTLDNGSKITKCIPASGEVNALELLKNENYKIEGTQKYGDAVVCRVNGLPGESFESCESMPPAEAYWAVIIKKKNVIPFLNNEWGWAQKGINETYLSEGDSLGLVFSTEGKLRWP